MKTYKFECTVWVRGESAKDAMDELHYEIASILEADNNLISLESDNGVEDEELKEAE